MARRRAPLSADRWSDEGDGRTRVLVEHADRAMLFAHRNVLEQAGYEVATCEGPVRRAQRCPLTEGRPCALANGADVVVHGLTSSRPDDDSVLVAFRAANPHTPVILEASQLVTDDIRDEVDGCEPLHLPVTARRLLGAVEAALRPSDEHPAPQPPQAGRTAG